MARARRRGEEMKQSQRAPQTNEVHFKQKPQICFECQCFKFTSQDLDVDLTDASLAGEECLSSCHGLTDPIHSISFKNNYVILLKSASFQSTLP